MLATELKALKSAELASLGLRLKLLNPLLGQQRRNQFRAELLFEYTGHVSATTKLMQPSATARLHIKKAGLLASMEAYPDAAEERKYAARLYLGMGKPLKAAAQYEDAMRDLRKVGIPKYLEEFAEAVVNAADCYEHAKRPMDAMKKRAHLAEIYETQELPEKLKLAGDQRMLAAADCEEAKNHKNALRQLEHALSDYEKANDIQSMARSYEFFCNVYLLIGSITKAFEARALADDFHTEHYRRTKSKEKTC